MNHMKRVEQPHDKEFHFACFYKVPIIIMHLLILLKGISII